MAISLLMAAVMSFIMATKGVELTDLLGT